MAALLAVLAACAQAPLVEESVVPGTIGLMVRQEGERVVVAAVSKDNPAVRVGDAVVRYNGKAISSVRQFYRLVIDSPPGSVARLELLREGTPHAVELPVRELDLMPRA